MQSLRRPAVVALAVALAVTACSTGTEGSPTRPADGADPGPSSSSPGSAESATAGTETSPTSVRPAPTGSAATSCVERTFAKLSPQQRAGQLLMVGLQAGSDPSSIADLIRGQHVGSVIYLGGWEGVDLVRRTSVQVQSYAPPGRQLLVAADQEGGRVWQIREPGTPRLPSARDQGAAAPSQRVAYGEQIGRLLRRGGVNVNLAPVADTVPDSIGTANQPIGRFGREYGSDPGTVGAAVPDVIRGLRAGGVASTLKHFPGIGRIRGNTDFSATGIDDREATTSDPYLEPFRAGIRSGADLVMVSSARYPKIDAANQAVFSTPIITGLLRRLMRFDGVVITDDVAAKALEGVPVAERATRFIAAGGDLVLTGQAADAGPMLAAIVARASSDPAFGTQVDASARRVLTLKVRRGLIDCG